MFDDDNQPYFLQRIKYSYARLHTYICIYRANEHYVCIQYDNYTTKY